MKHSIELAYGAIRWTGSRQCTRLRVTWPCSLMGEGLASWLVNSLSRANQHVCSYGKTTGPAQYPQACPYGQTTVPAQY
eukprot:425721-Rhodomonas_salina.1